MRYPALQGARDKNEPEIIKALEKAGATVEQLPTGKGVPDLLVGMKHWGLDGQRTGRSYNCLLEVKTEKGKLNKKQVKWHDAWRGQVAVVHTPEEALIACGLLK